jgi:hypothetical protein
MDTPSSTVPPKRPRLTARGVVLKFAVVWLIYTLSIGPMYWTWFGSTYVGGPYWVCALYSPLRIACLYVPPYGDLVENYIWWWNFPPSYELAEPLQQIAASQGS